MHTCTCTFVARVLHFSAFIELSDTHTHIINFTVQCMSKIVKSANSSGISINFLFLNVFLSLFDLNLQTLGGCSPSYSSCSYTYGPQCMIYVKLHLQEDGRNSHLNSHPWQQCSFLKIFLKSQFGYFDLSVEAFKKKMCSIPKISLSLSVNFLCLCKRSVFFLSLTCRNSQNVVRVLHAL